MGMACMLVYCGAAAYCGAAYEVVICGYDCIIGACEYEGIKVEVVWIGARGAMLVKSGASSPGMVRGSTAA